VLAIDLNHHLRKEGCSEKGLVQNVEDSFVQVHHDKVKSEFEVVLLCLAKLASMLENITKFLYQC
jgi:hypothetical protein